MAEINKFVYAGVKMTTELLSDEELNAMYMVALLHSDPRHVMGYEKAAPLFTEADGTKMHSAAKDALAVVWEERCGHRTI